MNRLKCWICGDPIKELDEKDYIPVSMRRERAVHGRCKDEAKA